MLTVGKASGIIPTGPLLISPDLAKDNLVTQCLILLKKYCWAHGCGSHKRLNGNSKAPGHKYKATTEIKIYRSNDGCTQLWCGRVLMAATNDNRNILLNSTDSTPIPHKLNSYKHELLSNSTKRINLKSDKGAMRNYIRRKDTIILNIP